MEEGRLGKMETETFFQLMSPLSAIVRPGRETLKEWMSLRRREKMSAEHSRGHVSPAIYPSACMSPLQIRYFYQSAVGSWNTEALFLSSKSDAERWRKGRRERKRLRIRWRRKKQEEKTVRGGSRDGWKGSEWESTICTMDIIGILNEGFCSTSTLTLLGRFHCTAVIFP